MTLTYHDLIQKKYMLETKLKKAKGLDKAPIKGKLEKLKILLQPHLDSNQKFEDKGGLEKEFVERIQKFSVKLIQALKANPLDEGMFKQVVSVCKKLSPLQDESRHSFLEMQPFLKYMDTFKAKPNQVIMESNDEYTHVEKRLALAKSQWKTAIGIIDDGARSWADEPHMFLMYLTDARDHLKLGKELLKGNPKKIDQATSMDTASREQMDNSVWNWTQNTLYDGYKKNDALIRARKEKAQLEENLEQATVIKPKMHL